VLAPQVDFGLQIGYRFNLLMAIYW